MTVTIDMVSSFESFGYDYRQATPDYHAKWGIVSKDGRKALVTLEGEQAYAILDAFKNLGIEHHAYRHFACCAVLESAPAEDILTAIFLQRH
jgi:hypothetical protein